MEKVFEMTVSLDIHIFVVLDFLFIDFYDEWGRCRGVSRGVCKGC